MPKRKNDDDFNHLYKKIKRLEKKLRKQSSSRNRSHSRSQSPDDRLNEDSQDRDHSIDIEVGDLLDGCVAPDPKNCIVNAGPVLMPDPHTATGVDTNTTATMPSTSDAQQEVNPLCEDSAAVETVLDRAMLDVLGEDPTISNTYSSDIHNDLAVRLEHITTHGISKDLRKELNEKYLLPGNCKLINAPALNAEIKAAISEFTIKRDKNIELRQKQIATAISCLGQTINILISKSNSVDPAIIKMLMDTERILCDSQHSDSVIRRNFILSTLKKDMKDQLQDTKPDTLLFGQNLAETIKTAKAIIKSGAELKTTVPKPQANIRKPQNASNNWKHLNWKGPFPPRKPPNQIPKTKEPPRNRPRPSTSLRPSQQQPTRGRR